MHFKLRKNLDANNFWCEKSSMRNIFGNLFRQIFFVPKFFAIKADHRSYLVVWEDQKFINQKGRKNYAATTVPLGTSELSR